MTTKRSAAAATIFSRRWAPPPPLISQPSGVTWSVPSIAMSSRSSSLNSSTGMPSSRACSSVATEVATQRMSAQTASGDRRQQVGDGRAGAEADGHPVLDQLRRRLGGEALLVVGSHGAALYLRRRRAWNVRIVDVPGPSAVYARVDGRTDLGDRGGWRAALVPAGGGADRRRSRSRGRRPARRRGRLLASPRDREPRRGADGDRPRQPQRHRAQRRAARPAPPPARRRHPDRRLPAARNLDPRGGRERRDGRGEASLRCH